MIVISVIENDLSLSLTKVTVTVDVTIIDNVPFSFFVDVCIIDILNNCK